MAESGEAWLERARAAVAKLHAGDVAGSIDLLVVVWRELRAPVLAAAIEKLTRQLPPAKPMDSRSRSIPRLHQLWLETAATRQPAHLPALVRGLLAPVPAQIAERVQALAAWPDDPRIALALAELVREMLAIEWLERAEDAL